MNESIDFQHGIAVGIFGQLRAHTREARVSIPRIGKKARLSTHFNTRGLAR